jgi:hypothetical protein
MGNTQMQALKLLSLFMYLILVINAYALPLDAPEVQSLSALKDGTVITVRWQPTCTTGSFTYHIQESQDDATWSTVYTGAGNSGGGGNTTYSNGYPQALSLGDGCNVNRQKHITLFNRANLTHYYRIKSCYTNSCSEYGSSVLAQPFPSIPQLSSVYIPGQAGFTLSVVPVAAGFITSYNLQENELGNGWASVGNVGSTVLKEYQSKFPGTYYYRANACNSRGCSVWSSSYSVVVSSPIQQCPL